MYANRFLIKSLVDRLTTGITTAFVIQALRDLAAGAILTPAQVSSVSDFLADASCPFSADEANVIRESLVAQEGGDEAVQVNSTAAEGAARRYRRYLEVHNTTSEPVTVRVQYLTVNDQDQWTWQPAAPGQSGRALTYELDPGEKTYLRHDGENLAAHRLRIWAVSKDGTEWSEFKDKNLELIEVDRSSGKRCYYADEMETFTYTLQ